MNKFEKLMLASAIFATSELVAMEDDIPNTILENTTLNVSGKVTANTAVAVNGALQVKGGEVTNNAIMTYGETGSLVIENFYQAESFFVKIDNISDGQTLKLSDFASIFEVGNWSFYSDSIKIEHSTVNDPWTNEYDNKDVTTGYFSLANNLTPNQIIIVIRKLTEYTSISSEQKQLSGATFDYILYNSQNQNEESKIIGSSDNGVDWNAIKSKIMIESDGIFKQSSLENENNDSSTYDTCFPTKGVLDVSAITKDSTNATFSGGKIVGGTIKLKHGTNKFLNLSVGADPDLPIVGVYQYDASMANKLETRIKDNYIKAENAALETKSPEEQFRSEFNDSDQINLNQDFEGQTDVTGGTTIKGLYLFADPETKASDRRKDFPGLLTDAELNTAENKLKTDDIIYERDSTDENYGKSAIIGLKDTSTLAVSTTTNSEPVIRIGFEGNGDLSFAGFETKTEAETTTIDYDKELNITSLTFSGDNSDYTGTVSFGEKVAKVVADGSNTLPKKLGESIKGNLENKAGTNTIENSGTTTIGSLTLSGGELTISKDTTIIIGE